ncbi:unnamed protein product [Oncorhynchus mykiss]|uniref:Uncharacterized protein n=1 Tax=Oncorhynchus mykiss TaxID=8022 RepID=A0A060Z4C1_ONCMY|nr:unnamed protein product [Oncorhynchus mykiss]
MTSLFQLFRPKAGDLRLCIFQDDIVKAFSLSDAVRSLRPVNEVSLSISSRTDTGVHALGNSAHFDLQRQNGKPPFAEEVLVDALNFHLRPEPIR